MRWGGEKENTPGEISIGREGTLDGNPPALGQRENQENRARVSAG